MDEWKHSKQIQFHHSDTVGSFSAVAKVCAVWTVLSWPRDESTALERKKELYRLQHVNVFRMECEICHVRFTAPLWSALTPMYRRRKDLCGLYWLEPVQDSNSSVQSLFFCVEVRAASASMADISNTAYVLGMKRLACAVKDCLVVMNQNNVSWLTSHKSFH